MIELWVDQVSTYAGDVDLLILVIGVITGVWFLLAEAFFFGLIFKYRVRPGRRAEYITGDEKERHRWITWPHALILVCDVVIIIGAVQVWVTIKQTLPEPDATVRVIAQQWAWTFEHPGPDGKLDTDDDIVTIDELHIRKDAVYHFELESRDVLHSFSVPVFRLKQDAIPGRIITGWFEPTLTGTYDIQCAEICGIGHGLMPGRVVIETPEQHTAWMAQKSPISVAAITLPSVAEK